MILVACFFLVRDRAFSHFPLLFSIEHFMPLLVIKFVSSACKR